MHGFRLVFALVLCSAALPAGRAQVIFTDVTAQAFPGGLAVSHFNWGDCDGDGDLDLFVTPKTIYLNSGPPAFTFTPKTDTGDLNAGPHGIAQWFDLDNDGDLDIFGMGGGDSERLYLNDGACRFTDISDADGDGNPNDYSDGGTSITMAPGDYDADGWLDFFVGLYERHCGGTPTVCADCQPDRLWRNLGNRKFQNTYATLGMEANERSKTGYCVVNTSIPCDDDGDCPAFPADSCKSGLCARSSNWVDYNNDGWLDLYIGQYRLDPNQMWQNNGNGTFTEVGVARNLDGHENSGAWGHTLGTDWADSNNDGDLEVYVANLAHCLYSMAGGHDISQFLVNSGPPNFNFNDRHKAAGFREWKTPLDLAVCAAWPDWAEDSPAWADYDNDGDIDIYVSYIYATSANNTSTLYSNNNNGTFANATAAHGVNLGTFENYSAAWADFDQDGDPDLLTEGSTAMGGPRTARLYRNDGGNANHWAQFVLRGRGASGSNREGIGVRVSATNNGVTQLREVLGNMGMEVARSSTVPAFGFGGGTDTDIDEVTVRWTTRLTETFTQVPMDRRYTLVEGARILRGTTPALPLPALAGGLTPYFDRTLDDATTWFYLVEGATQLEVAKDPARRAVVISFR